MVTWCGELTHLKRPWCLESLKAGGEGDNRGWDGWMASLTQWTWVWVNSGVGDGQEGLVCCRPWGRKESDTTEQLNWTELSHFSHVWLFATLWPVSPPVSSIHGILQARILEQVAMPSSRRSSQGWNPRIKLRSPALQADSLPSEPPGKPTLPQGALKKTVSWDAISHSTF